SEGGSDEAIHALRAVRVLDCFAALAMTWMGLKASMKSEVAYAAIALVRFSATLSRKPEVESQRWSAPTKSARSLVMKPASTVSTQTFSMVWANFASASLLSSLARCVRPRVQAKIEAIELVEVSLPFWCSR